jgi:hypothetical protein
MSMIFLWKIHSPILIMRKTSKKSQLRGILQNTCPELLKSVNVTENKYWGTIAAKSPVGHEN